MKKIVQVSETLVIVAILLVLVQTFLEDFAILAGWSWSTRKVLIFTGFGFDLFFTLEFLIRFFSAFTKGEAKIYFARRRGWVDFLASVPLILFNSGPMVLALVAGGGVARGLGGIFNVLKVAKAIRIARVLRLLRVLKVFKQIKHVSSPMAQRHTAKITTVAITATVFTFFAWSLLESGNVIPTGMENEYIRAQKISALRLAEEMEETEGNKRNSDAVSREKTPQYIVEEIMRQNPNLLVVKEKGETVYSRYTNSQMESLFGPGDYGYISSGEYGFFFSRMPLERERSKTTLLFFVIILAMVITFLGYYTPHFAITVSDPIHVMKRGSGNPKYNLEVEIPERYAEDDVFQLAKLYNEEYLPLKERMSEEEGGKSSDLSLSDLSGILGEEEKS